MVDRGTYARQWLSTSNSSSSRYRQSRDDQTNETLRRHEEWMQYIILMIQVNIFKYAIFPILYKYCLTTYLTTSCSKGTLHTVCRRRCHFLVPPHRVIHRPHRSIARRSVKLLYILYSSQNLDYKTCMTQSFLCYRLLTVARHVGCSGLEDLPHPVHLPRSRHCL
jgi:hypothetical protein